jgi:OOP family OmpA-OmpF porin
MKLKPQLLAACIAGAFAVSAQAQVAGSGLYVGGNVGQAKLKGDDFPGLDNSNTGGKLYGGYDFTPNIGMELGYVDLGSFGYGSGNLKANGVFLDGVGKVMFAPGWWGLARLGAFQGKRSVRPDRERRCACRVRTLQVQRAGREAQGRSLLCRLQLPLLIGTETQD